jgi:hypothetical protein
MLAVYPHSLHECRFDCVPVHEAIGKESYFHSGDGYLMPARKGQPPPDLRYFAPASK